MDTNVPFGWCVVPASVGKPALSDPSIITVTGGHDGRVVRATSRSDFGYLCMSEEALVIMAEGSFGTVAVGSNKTLVGKTHLGQGSSTKGSFKVTGANVIIRNFVIRGGVDGIAVEGGHHVWVDHCTFLNCGDGQINIVNGADKVVVSWCKFTDRHVKTMLINSGSMKTIDFGRLNVTLSHNFFDAVDQRNPRAGLGMIHILNCYYKSVGTLTSKGYGIHTYWKCKTTVERCNFIDTKDAVSHHKPDVVDPGYCHLIDNKLDAISKIGVTSETEKYKIFQIHEYYLYGWTVLDAEKVPQIVGNGAGTGEQWGEIGPIPIPGQGAVNVSQNPTLKWTKVGSKASNKVYFGKTFPPPFLKTVNGNSFQPGALEEGILYYWKINDNDVWVFRTEGEIKDGMKDMLTKGGVPTNVKHFFSINSNPVALSFYLNPVRSELKLKLNDSFSDTGVRDLILYDCLGKVIKKETALSNEHTVYVKTLPRGVYCISLTNKQAQIVRKFIKN